MNTKRSDRLSRADREDRNYLIAWMASNGASETEIAAEVGLSPRTVKAYVVKMRRAEFLLRRATLYKMAP